MTRRELQHFTDLREKINARLEEIDAPHRDEQIHVFPWLYGALGAVPAETMFICENPSLAGVRRANVETIDGGPPDIEAQWWGGWRNPAGKRFRLALFELGLKQTPPAARGGWKCYITNVVKEANIAREQEERKDRPQQATLWAGILAWELGQVEPHHVFAVGGRAYKAIVGLQAARLLPRFRVHQVWHYSARRSDELVTEKIVEGVRAVVG